MIVVTGGAGFIGSHLVESLVIDNEVTIIDNFSTGSMRNLQSVEGKVKIFRGDIRSMDISSLSKIDDIFHLAALPDVRESFEKPVEFLEVNVKGTLNVLEFARKKDAEKFVFSSSSTVYGEPEEMPCNEEYKVNPISHYGLQKYLAEELVKFYSKTYGIKGITLRLANIIGPRASHGVIHDFIKKLRSDKNKLEILGDGMQRKSYLYVKDTVNAILITWKKSQRMYEIYNVGNVDWITVNEIASIVEEEMGVKNVKHEYKWVEDGRGWKGDVKEILMSIEKIKLLGWSPTFSSSQAVRITVRELLGIKP
jgi:UDP-glucose 4-epimerase